jgi:hypothetical protein
VNILAAALRALDLGFLNIGDVVLLGEFLVAVRAMKSVLRHGASPSHIIAPIVVEGW